MTSHFAVFIKSLIFMQIFIFCLIVGVSIDINSYYLSHNPFKQMQSFAKPFSSITLDEKIYQNLFKKLVLFWPEVPIILMLGIICKVKCHSSS